MPYSSRILNIFDLSTESKALEKSADISAMCNLFRLDSSISLRRQRNWFSVDLPRLISNLVLAQNRSGNEWDLCHKFGDLYGYTLLPLPVGSGIDSTISPGVFNRAYLDTNGGGFILSGKVVDCLPCKMVFVTNMISWEVVDLIRDVIM